MTRTTKLERLKLNKFPPLTPEQRVALADALFEQEKRLRQGTYPAADVIAEIQKQNNADKPDPQWHQAQRLMEQFNGDNLTLARLQLEFTGASEDCSLINCFRSAQNLAFGWLNAKKEKDAADFLAVLDLLVPIVECHKGISTVDLLEQAVRYLQKISPELGAAYLSRLSGDLYARVKQDGLDKELEKFVERVRTSETTERDQNLVLAYFNLAMRLDDRQSAAVIAVSAPWRFAHEQIEAKYRLLTTNGGSGFSHVRERDDIKQSLRELRGQCLPHFHFTAACQVVEMTGEKEDFDLVVALFQQERHLLTPEERIRSLVRAFLASFRDEDQQASEAIDNHDRMLASWVSFSDPFRFHPRKQKDITDLFLTIFVVEAFKMGRLLDIELWDFAVSDLYGRSAVLPSSLAMVAEAVGAKAGLPSLLERAYALAQDEKFGLEERITALCRIARIKKKFEEKLK